MTKSLGSNLRHDHNPVQYPHNLPRHNPLSITDMKSLISVFKKVYSPHCIYVGYFLFPPSEIRAQLYITRCQRPQNLRTNKLRTHLNACICYVYACLCVRVDGFKGASPPEAICVCVQFTKKKICDSARQFITTRCHTRTVC